jgi:hypothetical protein
MSSIETVACNHALPGQLGPWDRDRRNQNPIVGRDTWSAFAVRL